MDFLKKKIRVTPEEDNLRLDLFLSNYVSSRSQAEKIIKNSLIEKKGKPEFLKPSYRVKSGEYFQVSIPLLKKTDSIQSYDLLIPIVFEDEYLVVVNKPAGVVVHPSLGHEQDTLVNALIGKVSLSSGVHPLRPGIVHRLDQNVSGLMVLTKTDEIQNQMIQQFKLKKVKRLYRALCIGPVRKVEDQIISFIGRHPKDRKRFFSFKEEQQKTRTKKAITHYKVLESFKEKIHHLECRLETGRTHQIRVHLSSKRLPVLGDTLYSSKTTYQPLSKLGVKNVKKDVQILNRLALYSAVMGFTHPVTGQYLKFSLPWPEEIHTLLEKFNFQKDLDGEQSSLKNRESC